MSTHIQRVEYKNSYIPPVIGDKNCNHTHLLPITETDMVESKCKMVTITVGIKCKYCKLHIACNHHCKIYGCHKSIQCGYTKCEECFIKSGQPEEIIKNKGLCILAYLYTV